MGIIHFLLGCAGFVGVFWTNQIAHLGVILSYYWVTKHLFALRRSLRNWECLELEIVPSISPQAVLETAKAVLSVSSENKRRILPQGMVYGEPTGSGAQTQQKDQEPKGFSTLPGFRFQILHHSGIVLRQQR